MDDKEKKKGKKEEEKKKEKKIKPANEKVPLLSQESSPEEKKRSCAPNSALRILVYSVYIVSIVAGIVICSRLRATVFSENLHEVGWIFAGIFVCLTVPLSVRDIIVHLMNYSNPRIQSLVVRIMWMVPIYAIESYLSLVFKQWNVYIEAARDCYESFVIYVFVRLLMELVAKDEEELEQVLSRKDEKDLRHLWPFSKFLSPWNRRNFISKTRKYTLQYVIIKVCGSLITLICQSIVINNETVSAPAPTPSGALSPATEPCKETETLYGEGEWKRLDRAYIYVALATNVSQTFAMYALVLFYHGMYAELKPYKPFYKFLCIKLVVFFSFWQGMVISAAANLGWILPTTNPALGKHTACWTVGEIENGFQDFLITIEMLFAAAAHHFVFPYTDFQAEGSKQHSFLTALADSTIPDDVFVDVKNSFRVQRQTSENTNSEI